MKHSLLSVFVVVLVLISSQVQAQTELSGALSGTLSEDLYLVIDDIWVAENDTLDIDAGTTLRFTGVFSFLIDGLLRASGTSASPIAFTDPSNQWLGITFSSSASSAGNLTYVFIENSDYNGVTINGSAPVLNHCLIRNNAEAGLALGASAGAVQVFNSTIEANGARGVTVGGSSSLIMFDSVIQGNLSTSGGGMAVFGGFADLLGVQFIDNQSTGFDQEGGGGLYVTGDATVNVSNCKFIGNSTFDDDDGGNGGAIHISGADVNISGTIFEGNSTEAWDDGGNGGAIYANGGNHYISNCDFFDNSSIGWQQDGAGAAVMLENFGNSQINYCRFANNTATGEYAFGGAIALYNGTRMDLIRDTFSNNSTDVYGGVVYAENCDLLTSTNSTFYGNMSGDAGAAIYAADTDLEMSNVIIAYHNGVAVHAAGTSTMGLGYCDFYGPSQTDFGGNVAPGLGDIVQTNNNGDPCDAFYNIYLDPMIINGPEDDLRILPGSPCVDAGDPDFGDDPDGTVVDIGRHHLQTGEIDLRLEVVQEVVEPEGGSFVYDAMVTSYAASGFASMRYAAQLELPDGTVLPQLFHQAVFPLAPWQILQASGLTINVPSFAPPGIYTLTGYIGLSPTQIADSWFIFFQKLWPTTADSRPVSGSDFSESGSGWVAAPASDATGKQAVQPDEFVLHQAWPNPFNARTQIAFDLPEGSRITVQVFDVLGRQVVELQDGVMRAGQHALTFDGAGLSSGLYFIHVDAGKVGSRIQKVTLLK
ncbi:right-handed parallel beta-helix repeat-containing protein [bacterium]|nr:right-handed parallel beta-helix repeat-containing protein [bacterium]